MNNSMETVQEDSIDFQVQYRDSTVMNAVESPEYMYKGLRRSKQEQLIIRQVHKRQIRA